MDTNKNHTTYYTEATDYVPVLQYGELEIQVIDSETAELHFNDNRELHLVIDREALERICSAMDSLKTTKHA